ncbi:hypothetical protein RB195_017147 [Necator americanus]|uniref:PH domain-containing protein n=1 Tax=Necator americanus TaxID=51031 RepID=A0ABR1C706_NECAM
MKHSNAATPLGTHRRTCHENAAFSAKFISYEPEIVVRKILVAFWVDGKDPKTNGKKERISIGQAIPLCGGVLTSLQRSYGGNNNNLDSFGSWFRIVTSQEDNDLFWLRRLRGSLAKVLPLQTRTKGGNAETLATIKNTIEGITPRI